MNTTQTATRKRGGARKGAGRPRGTRQTSRRRTLHVVVSPLAEAEIRRAAAESGKSVSAWLWEAVLAHYARTVPSLAE
jgi:hypothetical protein